MKIVIDFVHQLAMISLEISSSDYSNNDVNVVWRYSTL